MNPTKLLTSISKDFCVVLLMHCVVLWYISSKAVNSNIDNCKFIFLNPVSSTAICRENVTVVKVEVYIYRYIYTYSGPLQTWANDRKALTMQLKSLFNYLIFENYHFTLQLFSVQKCYFHEALNDERPCKSSILRH